jgi:hypothetical protein
LLEVLGNEDPSNALDRETAIFALRRWISYKAGQGRRLYNEKTKTGLLIDLKYRTNEANIIFTLLHDLPQEDRSKPEIYEVLASYLRSKRVAIAELSYYHLRRLAVGVKLPPFNAADPWKDRDKVATEIETLIKKKVLPPRAVEKPKGS